MAAVLQTTFLNASFKVNVWTLIKISRDTFITVYNWQGTNNGSDNGLMLNKQLAITWTNVDH